ncbi:hypothetical protein B484DRAFT_78438 [Ochromonadaceae sp. CCMP2298]|nr:hypothetical protein B484DRAFT_78438 [Ochromonadaceae sp. CCMP2298]
MIAGAAYGIAVVTAGTVLLLVKRLCTPSAEADSSSDGSGGSGGSGGRIVRRMSFSSSVMANGVFPPQAKVWKTVINTAMFFDQCPSLDLVVERASTLLRYDRFRCCLVQERGRLVLREIAKLDPARDIIRTVQVSSDAELAQAVDRLCNEELVTGDGLPLWGMVRLQNSGGRSALLTRLHHCIGDGIALIGCLNDIFQDEQGGPLDLSIGRSMSGGSSSRFSLSSLMNFLKSALKVLLLPLTRYDSDLAFSPRDRARLDMAGQTR